MKYTIGFSPCPNDTFIFDALVNGKIDTGGIVFEPVMEDIQTLNAWGAEGRLDITKLSFPSFLKNREHYTMLRSGAALGKGVGPLLVAKSMVNIPDIQHCSIAIPGEDTTANFLLGFAFPDAKQKTAMLFSGIEDAVLMGKFDLGVIIHENRFTYHQKGLIKVCDLGEIWEQRQNLPIPLACIAARQSIPDDQRQTIEDLIRKSVAHSFAAYPAISDFVKTHAQAMQEDVMRQHIELYVNDYTVDIGEEGRQAIESLTAVQERLLAVHS